MIGLKVLQVIHFLVFLNLVLQDTHNQAGIAQDGGIMPLLKLLDSKNVSLQHNAAFALYGLADNEVSKGHWFVVFSIVVL